MMVLNYLIIAVFVIICVYPFLNVLAYSLSGNRPILSGEITFFPKELQFKSYIEILGKNAIWTSMGITIFVTAIGTILGLLLTIGASYALSKKRLKGRGILTAFIMFTMYFSGGIIPTFLVVKNLNLVDSVWALILPSAMNVFNFIVMKTFFMQLPESLEEAAVLDGCNDLSCLLKIVLPLSLPIIATIGLFYAVAYWNEYFSALMYIQSPEKFTLQLRLRQLLFTEELNQLNNNTEGLGNQVMAESLKMTSIVVATLPIVAIYPWLQKYFVKGVMLGAVKG
ncbi:ABC transporter permease subunit [Anaerocolumna sedimenticola]|uniref:ABC transporter permease subunit n=2 Tax=Anaerocolumna sedimenticola TaxID=2696063 RepID=A0A6P1TUZ4_9FIRM|nr:ABC transporter permease subunit [Anaerocolumna sedimenticola]